MNAFLVRLVLGPFLLVLAFAASAGGAFANPACDAYARTAQNQFADAQRLGCTGGQPEWWNPGYDYHFDWCVSLPAASALPAMGTADRAAVLAQCLAASGGGGAGGGGVAGGAISCDAYSKRAIAQFRDFNRLKCSNPVNGAWWNGEFDYHNNWCASLPAGSLLPAQGIADRDVVLSDCAGRCPTTWATAGISGQYYPDAECRAMCNAMTSCTRARSAGAEGCLFCLD